MVRLGDDPRPQVHLAAARTAIIRERLAVHQAVYVHRGGMSTDVYPPGWTKVYNRRNGQPLGYKEEAGANPARARRCNRGQTPQTHCPEWDGKGGAKDDPEARTPACSIICPRVSRNVHRATTDEIRHPWSESAKDVLFSPPDRYENARNLRPHRTELDEMRRQLTVRVASGSCLGCE